MRQQQDARRSRTGPWGFVMAKLKKSSVVGDWFWTTGPLVLGTEAVRDAVQTRREPAILKALARVTSGTVVEHKVAGERVVLFPGQFPSTWHQLGPRAGVLVRMAGHTNHALEALSVDPWAVSEAEWKLAVGAVKLDGPTTGARSLFDSVPRDPRPIKPANAGVAPITLPNGSYVVDHATTGERDFSVALYRLRPKDEVPVAPSGKKPAVRPGPPANLVLRKETVALARKLEFIETEGGPVLVCPKVLLPHWHGVYDAKGTFIYEQAACDYDRACEAKKLIIPVGRGQAMVLEHESTAFVQTAPGVAYLLQWIGADAASHVLEAVLSAPPKSWKRLKEVFTMTGTQLALIDSANAGKDKPGFVGPLAPGRYAIERMVEYDGQIQVGTRLHGLMASGLRLTKLP